MPFSFTLATYDSDYIRDFAINVPEFPLYSQIIATLDFTATTGEKGNISVYMPNTGTLVSQTRMTAWMSIGASVTQKDYSIKTLMSLYYSSSEENCIQYHNAYDAPNVYIPAKLSLTPNTSNIILRFIGAHSSDTYDGESPATITGNFCVYGKEVIKL